LRFADRGYDRVGPCALIVTETVDGRAAGFGRDEELGAAMRRIGRVSRQAASDEEIAIRCTLWRARPISRAVPAIDRAWRAPRRALATTQR
jgi:hypothetical protein